MQLSHRESGESPAPLLTPPLQLARNPFTVWRKGKHAAMPNAGTCRPIISHRAAGGLAKEIIQFPSSLKPFYLLMPLPPLLDTWVRRCVGTLSSNSSGTLQGMRAPQHWPYTPDGNREHKTTLCSVPSSRHTPHWFLLLKARRQCIFIHCCDKFEQSNTTRPWVGKWLIQCAEITSQCLLMSICLWPSAASSLAFE